MRSTFEWRSSSSYSEHVRVDMCILYLANMPQKSICDIWWQSIDEAHTGSYMLPMCGSIQPVNDLVCWHVALFGESMLCTETQLLHRRVLTCIRLVFLHTHTLFVTYWYFGCQCKVLHVWLGMILRQLILKRDFDLWISLLKDGGCVWCAGCVCLPPRSVPAAFLCGLAV